MLRANELKLVVLHWCLLRAYHFRKYRSTYLLEVVLLGVHHLTRSMFSFHVSKLRLTVPRPIY